MSPPGKKIHFDDATPDELAQGRQGLAAWFESLPPELRAEIEAQAARDGTPSSAATPASPEAPSGVVKAAPPGRRRRRA